MATADVRLYLLGTVWEVEIDFEYDSEDNWETIDISEVWLLGYYPEKSVGIGQDYVPCRIKADLLSMSNHDYQNCIEIVKEYIGEVREARRRGEHLL
jgi:hypothetical protein